MYHRLGSFVSRHPWPVVAGWVVVLASLLTWAPRAQQISKDGVFSFLPAGSPSLQAERLFREAFPRTAEDADEVHAAQQDPLGSNIVIVVRREDRRDGLTEEDRAFVEDVLKPRLEELRMTTPANRWRVDESLLQQQLPSADRRIRSIWTARHHRTGPLLDSADGMSTLVVMELQGEFLDYGNGLAIARVEDCLMSAAVQQAIPPGLDLAISGSATVGRDMLVAESQSASRTELWTKALVIVLLLLIYRAPIVALIPLATVGVAVAVAIRLLATMASMDWVGFFSGMETYVTVVVYGAGVDYCLFLIARYREELERGASDSEAVSRSVGLVGAALAASAGTSIFGILMMMFAEFGKFRQAGFAISFGMFVVLLAGLTLTPALMRLFGRWAFWPDVRKERISPEQGWGASSSPGLLKAIEERRWFDRGWELTAELLKARPGAVFVGSLLCMAPFAAIAIRNYENLSYGLLSELPQDVPSVVGARAIQEHFPAGVAGVATVLLENSEFLGEPSEETGERKSDLLRTERISGQIVAAMQPQFAELGLVDIRCQKHPLGLLPHAVNYLRSQPPRNRRSARTMAHRAYTSLEGPLAGTVMRFDLVFEDDPFTRDSITRLTQAVDAIARVAPGACAAAVDRSGEEVLDDEAAAAGEETADAGGEGAANDAPGAAVPPPAPNPVWDSTRIVVMGPSAGIRDLKHTTDRDQLRINVLVVTAVYLVLIALLRRPAISAYLIVSVVFSYLVTMGVTYAVFWMVNPGEFAGLDWKVPIFTFTLLIALGEDYNILLMARVTEEQRVHGLIPGVLAALTKTGGIISSCGIIMAGTFCSLMTGTLLGMVQLGFALAFGVLLDTFVVRPVLVPAYLILLYHGQFGPLGPLLGAPRGDAATTAVSTPLTPPDAASAAAPTAPVRPPMFISPPAPAPSAGAPDDSAHVVSTGSGAPRRSPHRGSGG